MTKSITRETLVAEFGEGRLAGVTITTHPSGTVKSVEVVRPWRRTSVELSEDGENGSRSDVYRFEDDDSVDDDDRLAKLREWFTEQVRFVVETSDNRILCTFCQKTDLQVRKLIAGPNCYICDECIGLCTAILDEELGHNR